MDFKPGIATNHTNSEYAEQCLQEYMQVEPIC
ncbi:hypothetical protein JL09_g5582 [Pichia kudriavzevii]|uniref:Uncharacterized protein n=1 Tax=Pichia kudriavzevii TaxID=4909 RepID=A0A099NR51_PICKU|nr:hypothetical protein JL09_g5582 [Pichia kudriavzevii]